MSQQITHYTTGEGGGRVCREVNEHGGLLVTDITLVDCIECLHIYIDAVGRTAARKLRETALDRALRAPYDGDVRSAITVGRNIVAIADQFESYLRDGAPVEPAPT